MSAKETTIKLKLNDASHDIALSEDADLTTHIDEILESTAVYGILKSAAKGASPMLYNRHGNDTLDQRTVDELADTLLRNGLDGLETKIRDELVDSYEYDAGISDEIAKGTKIKALHKACIGELSRIHASEPVADTFGDAFHEKLLGIIRDVDTTTELDIIHGWEKTNVCHSPAITEDTGIDEAWIHSCLSTGLDASSVVPNEQFAAFLKMVNIGSDDFVAAMRAVDRDPTVFAPGSATTGYQKSLIKENVEKWASFKVDADPSKPPLISVDDVIEVLDNASYGGIPVIMFRCGLKDLARLPWDEEGACVCVTPEGRGKPQIGIHDFINGSGHTVGMSAPEAVLALSRDSWFSDNCRYRHGLDKCCGFVQSALTVGLAPLPAPEPETAASPKP